MRPSAEWRAPLPWGLAERELGPPRRAASRDDPRHSRGADEVAAFDEASRGEEGADLAARADAGDGGDERQAGQGGEILRRHEGNAFHPLTQAARMELDDVGRASALGQQRLSQRAAGLAVTSEDVARLAAQKVCGEERR